jgi:3-deoxy-D-manno-octulosonic-acid transferase
MAPSLGLTLYNLGQRRDTAKESARPDRPAGSLAWLHAPSETSALTQFALARRLIEDDGMVVLLTSPVALPPRPGVILQPPPPDNPLDARAFLDHWRPEIAVFAEGEIRPSVLHETDERNIPLIMVDAKQPNLLRNREGWYPGLMRAALSCFRHVRALDETAARSFRRAGASLSAVAVTGRMEEESTALPCLEAERVVLAKLFAARPVWFAAGLPQVEEAAVLEAHKSAVQLAHRLLLIILPEDPSRGEALARHVEEFEGRAVALRSRDEEPDPETEIFIVDNPAEYGLWYRLAPVTFIGGSLLGAGAVRNPLEAASLGSAILHGPRPGLYADTFVRLKAGRATRSLGSTAELVEGLSAVLAPDRSARLAQSAWAVASEGAEVTDRTVSLIRRLIDGPD